MTKKPNNHQGPVHTTTTLSGETVRTLRAYADAADLYTSSPFSGPEWVEFIQSVLKDGRFSEFDANSLLSYLRKQFDWDGEARNWDASQAARDSLNNGLFEALNAHPRRYTFVVELSGFHTYSGYLIELSPDVSIFTENSGYIASENGSRNEDRAYLSLSANGVIPMFGKGSAHDGLEAMLKHVCFLLRRDPRIGTGFSVGFPNTQLFGEHEDVIGASYFDAPPLQLLSGLRINEEILCTPKGLLAPIIDTPQAKAAEFSTGWETAKSFFRLSDATVKEPLAAAMEWYIDSALDSNETVSYLKACIGIEAILGDAKEGLTEISRRLEDRYAFMTGKNRAERKDLGDSLRKVLNARGALVHARQRRLERAERALLSKAQEILKNCIDHELATLTPNEPERRGLQMGRL
jgi:hypothetical protein